MDKVSEPTVQSNQSHSPSELAGAQRSNPSPTRQIKKLKPRRGKKNCKGEKGEDPCKWNVIYEEDLVHI